MKSVFKTKSGIVLHLRPVSPAMYNKCSRIATANRDKPPEEIAPVFLALLSELFEEGITKFELTREQAAFVTLTRPELKKIIPGLRNSVSDFALFIFSQVKTYEDLTALAVAILEVTSKKKPYRVETGRLGVFGRLFSVKG